MDSLVEALLIITVPFDLLIIMAGLYLIKAYSHEQALVREQLHDAEITNREALRLEKAKIMNGQGGDDGISSLITQFAPMLLAGLQKQPAAVQESTDNGKV